MDKNPDETCWRPWQTAMDCARNKFKKNEVFTAHQFHEKCGIDYDTATKYLPRMVGKDLGGGKKIISADVATQGYVLDPPEEDSREVARIECCRVCGCDRIEESSVRASPWGSVLVPMLFFGFLIVLADLVSRSSLLMCANCGTTINVAGWKEPSFKCPVCETYYVRQMHTDSG